MTFEKLCEHLTYLTSIEDDFEYENELCLLGNDINTFLSNGYEELLDQIDAEDDEVLTDCLNESNSEKEFILNLIRYYSVNVYELMKVDKDKLLEQYFQLKNL